MNPATKRPNLKTEAIAGITTFFTMAYIVIVNPQILSADGKTGMAFNGVCCGKAVKYPSPHDEWYRPNNEDRKVALVNPVAAYSNSNE